MADQIRIGEGKGVVGEGIGGERILEGGVEGRDKGDLLEAEVEEEDDVAGEFAEGFVEFEDAVGLGFEGAEDEDEVGEEFLVAIVLDQVGGIQRIHIVPFMYFKKKKNWV